MQKPSSILITGASSGIGAALARYYADPGVTLALLGRNPERLADVAELCRSRGAAVNAATIDITDLPGLTAWIDQCDDARPLDLAIANAGTSRGIRKLSQLDEITREIFATNVTGTFNTVHPIIDRMSARGHGQIAIVSSMTGFRGLPGATAYSASKATVKAYGEGLRGMLRPRGIRVSVVCPGFVHSRMTADNPFPMPMIMKADRAAAIIGRGLARDKGRIAFPWPVYMAAWLLQSLPDAITDRITQRFPAKPL